MTERFKNWKKTDLQIFNENSAIEKYNIKVYIIFDIA